MKYVELLKFEKVNSYEVIKTILEQPMQGGINLPTFRARAKALKALETGTSESWLVLEDAVYDALKGALDAFQFAVVMTDLDTIIGKIEKPETSPPVDLAPVV